MIFWHCLLKYVIKNELHLTLISRYHITILKETLKLNAKGNDENHARQTWELSEIAWREVQSETVLGLKVDAIFDSFITALSPHEYNFWNDVWSMTVYWPSTLNHYREFQYCLLRELKNRLHDTLGSFPI